MASNDVDALLLDLLGDEEEETRDKQKPIFSEQAFPIKPSSEHDGADDDWAPVPEPEKGTHQPLPASQRGLHNEDKGSGAGSRNGVVPQPSLDMLDWSDFASAPANPRVGTLHIAQLPPRQQFETTGDAGGADIRTGQAQASSAQSAGQLDDDDEDDHFDRLSLGGLDAEVPEVEADPGVDDLLKLAHAPVQRSQGAHDAGGVMPTSEAAPSQCIPKQQLLQGHQQPVVASIQGSWGVQAITGGPSASVQATANVTGAGGRGGELNRAERLVSASEQLPLHELVLQQAALAEEALLMGPPPSTNPPPLDQLSELLADARSDWPAAGRPDASGAMIGGSVALKLEELTRMVPSLGQALSPHEYSSEGAAGTPAALHGGAHGQATGKPRVVCIQGPVVAVGTSTGATLVAQLPTISAAAAAAGGAAPAASDVPLMVVGDARSEAESVTAAGFSHVTSAGEPMWLAVGHASGVVNVWDLARRPARLVVSITGQHGLPVTHVSFFPSRSTSLLLTCDRRGRLVIHTLSTNVLLLRTSAASRVVLDGSLGIISSVAHLVPFTATLPAVNAQQLEQAKAASQNSEGAGASTSTTEAGTASSSTTVVAESSSVTVGEGMVALCTNTGVHIARFRPSGDFIFLFTLPKTAPLQGNLGGASEPGARGGNTQQSASSASTFPRAAWAPHMRRGTTLPPVVLSASLPVPVQPGGAPGAAGATQQPGAQGFSATSIAGSTVSSPRDSTIVQQLAQMPFASLAVAWGSSVTFLEIPLLGDHRAVAPQDSSASAGGAAGAGTTAAVQSSDGSGTASTGVGAVVPSGTISSGKGGPAGKAGATASGPGATPQPAPAAAAPVAPTTPAPGGPGGAFNSATRRLFGVMTGAAGRAAAVVPGAMAGAGATLGSTLTAAAAAAVGVNEPLTPPVVKTLGRVFPPQVTKQWDSSQQLQGDHELVEGGSGGVPGNVEDQRGVLALHWYDGDALGVIAQQGLQMRLVVLGVELEVRESVECFDTPQASPYYTTSTTPLGLPTCPESIAGQGSRVLLLGASGTLYCSRLMSWQERLRTLQDVGKHRLALWFGLELLRSHVSRRTVTLAASLPPGHPAPPVTAAEVAQAEQLTPWLLSLTVANASDAVAACITAFTSVHRKLLTQPELLRSLGMVMEQLGAIQDGTGGSSQQAVQWWQYLWHAALQVAAAAPHSQGGSSVQPSLSQQEALRVLGSSAAENFSASTVTASKALLSSLKFDPAVVSDVHAAARSSLCFCLLLKSESALFERIFPLLQSAQEQLSALKLDMSAGINSAATHAPAAAPAGLTNSDTGSTRSGTDLTAAQGRQVSQLPSLSVCGPLSAFLEILEPHILADRLPVLPPEVVQALVEHMSGAQDPQRVERCVLHLDVYSLDLNQVLKLCEHYGLFSALAYVHVRLREYRRPLLAMLEAVARHKHAQLSGSFNPPGSAPVHSLQPPQVIAYRLLVYLRTLFSGHPFPPGIERLAALEGASAAEGAEAGGMPPLLGASVSELKAQLLGVLLFADSKELSQEWGWQAGSVAQVVSDPYPALQLLLEQDAAATVSVLGEAVNGWDAVETELRAAAGHPALELDRVRVATQVLADALGDLLQSGSLDDSSRQQLPDQQGGLQHLSPAAAAVLDFVTGLLAAGRVTVAPALMLKVLRHVLGPPTATSTASSGTQGPTAAGKPGSKLYALSGASSSAGAGVGSPSSLASAALTPSAPQERLVLRLLEVVGVVPLSLSQAGGSGRAPGAFPPPASQLQQQQRQNEAHQLQPSTERLDGADFEAALALCYEHGMLLAAGRLLHLRRDVGAALATYLEVPAPEPAFAYIHTCMTGADGLPATKGLARAMGAAVLDHAQHLASRSPAASAAVLLAYLPDQQYAFLGKLEEGGQQEVLFKVLHALLGLADRLDQEAALHYGAASTALTGEGDGTAAPQPPLLPMPSMTSTSGNPFGTAEMPWVGAHADDLAPTLTSPLIDMILPLGTPPVTRTHDLRTRADTCELYVRLACQFRPHLVLPFLMRHTAYDVRTCMEAVRKAGVRDAHAYLLERAGELDAALTLHLTAVKEAHEGLRSSLLSGRLPLWGTMQDIHHPPQVQQQLQQPLHQSSVFATLQPRVSNGVGHDQLTAQQAPVLPLPQPQPGQDTQQPDTGSITHIRWLLALSPRLRSVLPRVCGPQAVNAALTRAGSGNRVNGSASAGSNRRTATAGSGASSSLTTNTTQPQPYSSVTGTGTKHGSYSLSAQHSIGTLSQVAPVPPVAVPQELRLCWAGLMCAVGFCDRCSKTARARVGAGGADRGGGSSENGKGESKAAASTAVGPGSVKQPGGPQEGAADVSTKYWFTLLESYISPMQDAMQLQSLEEGANHHAQQEGHQDQQGTAAQGQQQHQAGAARALAHIFGALLEEVLSHAGDHVSLTVIISHISSTHGGAAFGDFKATLAGLFSACAYEGAIMGAASRLISRDALSHVRRKYRRYTSGTEASLEPDAVQSLPQGTTINRPQATPGGGEGAASSFSAAAQFRLVSDLVRSDLQHSFNQRLWQGRGARSTAAAALSASSSVLVGSGAPLLIPLAPSVVPAAMAGDFAVRAQQSRPSLRSHIDVRGLLAAHGLLHSKHQPESPGPHQRAYGHATEEDGWAEHHSRHDQRQAGAGSRAHGAAGYAGTQGHPHSARADAFDVDDLLDWAATGLG